MRGLKPTSIAIAILLSLSLFGMVKNSEGFEITSMSVENGASGCYVSLTADADILWIDWYIDNEHVHHSMYSAGTRSVYENIGYLSGSPFGKSYTIKAKAVHWDDNGEEHVSESDPYDLTVYSTPKTKTEFGDHTMAELYASIDVGWNGHTAEVTAEASVKTYSQFQIGYGLNLRYKVVRLTPRGNWAADLWVQPPGLWRGGALLAKEGSFAITPPYSKSDSMDLRGGQLDPGDYRVEGQVTASANLGKNFDFLSVPDSEDLFVPDDPLNE